MKTQEYFKAIAEDVRRKRTKGEYSTEELRIFEEGKKEALREILRYFMEAHTSKKKSLEISGIFEKESFTSVELANFCKVEISYFRESLRKALLRVKSQQGLIDTFTRLEI